MLTEAAVRRYFGGRAEVTSFAVADDALSGRVDGALGKLRWALSTGVAPVLITSALSNNLRSLGKYLDGRDARLRDADLARVDRRPAVEAEGPVAAVARLEAGGRRRRDPGRRRGRRRRSRARPAIPASPWSRSC